MRGILRRIRVLLERLNLLPEMDDPDMVLSTIARDVTFRGINLWILITATVVASVGLNVNSTAVIIGAMLISPLMGPIIGVGASLAIYDVSLFRKSLRNLIVAVAFSLITSAAYFALSPLKEPGSELIARTTPTIWDVIIAFFGGLSGIIAALGREKRTNVIAGVAIATALMPPLCTAGYGMGTLQGRFFLGALYLFLINAVFISASAYVTLQIIRFPNKEFVDKAYQLRIRRLFLGIAIATLLPSLYVAYTVVRDAFEETRVRRFLEEGFAPYSLTSVVEHKRVKVGDSVLLRLVLVGEPLNAQQVEALYALLHHTYKLPRYRLEVIQGLGRGDLVRTEFFRLTDSLQVLHSRLMVYERYQAEKNRLLTELYALFPGVGSAGIGQIEIDGDTVAVVLVSSSLPEPEQSRLTAWLRTRLSVKEVRVVEHKTSDEPQP